jgi:fibronectin type 3 domain-containing protein
MKTKFLLVLLFSAFFISKGFSTKYEVMRVRGSVTVRYNSASTALTYTGQQFDSNAPLSELSLPSCESSITFAEVRYNIRTRRKTLTQPQTASRNCTRVRQCATPDCRPDNLTAAVMGAGTQRDLLEVYLNGGQLTDIEMESIHQASLDNIAQSLQVKTAPMQPYQKVDVFQQKVVTPVVIQRQNIPLNNKNIKQ